MSVRRKTDCALGTITPIMTGKGIRYRLRATIDGRRESLGCFNTIDEARAQSQAYFELLHDHSKSLTVAAWGTQWLDDREERGHTGASRTPGHCGIDISSPRISPRSHSAR